MTKEFIPYEQALELKKIGFDEDCFKYYNEEITLSTVGLYYTYDNPMDFKCLAPTFSQAFRWFREKYNIDSWIQPFTSEKSNGVLYLPDESYSYFIFKDGVWVDDKVDFLEPEESELACLKKLIEIVKNNINE